MRPAQQAGLVFWRAGLLLSGGWSLYESWGWLLRRLELPFPVEVGLALVLTGCAFVLGSLFVERVQDAREEGDLLS